MKYGIPGLLMLTFASHAFATFDPLCAQSMTIVSTNVNGRSDVNEIVGRNITDMVQIMGDMATAEHYQGLSRNNGIIHVVNFVPKDNASIEKVSSKIGELVSVDGQFLRTNDLSIHDASMSQKNDPKLQVASDKEVLIEACKRGACAAGLLAASIFIGKEAGELFQKASDTWAKTGGGILLTVSALGIASGVLAFWLRISIPFSYILSKATGEREPNLYDQGKAASSLKLLIESVQSVGPGDAVVIFFTAPFSAQNSNNQLRKILRPLIGTRPGLPKLMDKFNLKKVADK